MLEEMDTDTNEIFEEISIKVNNRAWMDGITGYEKLRGYFFEKKLKFQAILALVSVASLQEKLGQIERAGKTILRAAEEFETIKKMGHAFKAYQRAIELLKHSNKIEIIKKLQEKIESLGILDIVIVVDTTGSMGSVLDAIKKEIAKMLYYLSEKIPGIRIGALAYRDHCDEGSSYLLKSHPFIESKDYASIIGFVKEWSADGGGDIPEAIEDAINYLPNFDWETMKKIAIFIADAPPHEKENCPKKLDWKNEIQKIRDLEIQVNTIQSGSDSSAENIFKEIANLTNGKHFKLQNISDLPDLIVAIALSQVEIVEDFILDLDAKGKLTDSKKQLLETFLR